MTRPLRSARATRNLAAVALGAALALAPATALAQFGVGDGGTTGTGTNGLSISQVGIVARYYPDGRTLYNFRAANLNPNDINYQDCSDDIILQFTLALGGLPTTDTIQVWAGTTDCTQSSARETSTGPYCWQVAPTGSFANSMTSTGNIYARNITKYIDNTSIFHSAPVTSVPGPEACHTQTTSGEIQLSLYFIFLNADGITVDASLSYGQNVDMVGPLAPQLQLPIGIGDGLLLLNWTPQLDSTIQGFNIYAEDQGPNGLGLGVEAGAAIQTTPIYCHTGGVTTCLDSGMPDASDDSGLDGGISLDASCSTAYADGSTFTSIGDASGYASLSDADLSAMGCVRGSPVNTISTEQGSGTCTSSALVNVFTTSVTDTSTGDAGLTDGSSAILTTADGGTIGGTTAVGISNIDYSKYGVGNVGGNTTSSYVVTSVTYPNGTSGPLIDGHQYAIAVAAYDGDGNVGAISALGCQTPEPVIDFWKQYRQDGGLAGGGFCSLEAAGAPVAGSVFGLGIGTALVALTRRRRRRHS